MWVGEGLKIEEIHGKGRGLVSTQPLKGGQIVLKDSPILLYSTRPLNPSQQQTHSISILYCDKCFRRIQSASAAIPCPSCSHNHHFCSTHCLSAATASSHSPWVCQSLVRLCNHPALTVHQPLERQVQARYLVAAYNLALVSPSQFQLLLSLQSSQSDDDIASRQAAGFLHSLISTLCPPPTTTQGFAFGFSLELTSSLLARDKLNAFGLMENNGGERSVRAYGIYPMASLFNHDCLPNACRFDYVDSVSDSNTDIIVRMIHDVPEGREICLSYFPVNENYPSRQKRLLEDYGFTCDCDRCKVEANWSDSDQEEKEGGELDQLEVMDEDQDEEMEAGEEDLHSGDHEAQEDFPHAYFFLRYMCSMENCWGTMAPLPPSDGNPSNILECNVCGNLKNDELLGAEC